MLSLCRIEWCALHQAIILLAEMDRIFINEYPICECNPLMAKQIKRPKKRSQTFTNNRRNCLRICIL